MHYIIVSEVINKKSTKDAYAYRDYFDCDIWIPRLAIIDTIELEDYNYKLILSSKFIKQLEYESKMPHFKYRYNAQYILKQLLNKPLKELKKIEAAQAQPPENTALY